MHSILFHPSPILILDLFLQPVHYTRLAAYLNKVNCFLVCFYQSVDNFIVRLSINAILILLSIVKKLNGFEIIVRTL